MSKSVIIVICGLIGFGIFITIIAHDIYAQNQKQDQMYHENLMKESCSDLNDSISFFNNLNEGQWIKPYDTSDFKQRMKELNCK